MTGPLCFSGPSRIQEAQAGQDFRLFVSYPMASNVGESVTGPLPFQIYHGSPADYSNFNFYKYFRQLFLSCNPLYFLGFYHS
jgi:hypothetical protein